MWHVNCTIEPNAGETQAPIASGIGKRSLGRPCAGIGGERKWARGVRDSTVQYVAVESAGTDAIIQYAIREGLTMRTFMLLMIAAAAAAGGVASESVAADEKPRQKDEQVAAMQGVWAIKAFTIDGNAISPDQLKNWRRIVKKNHVTWKNGDDAMIELDITFDPTQKPMTLDSTIATGESKGQVLRAIYEFKVDELRVCFADAENARPKDFSSTSGNGQSLFVARRVKE